MLALRIPSGTPIVLGTPAKPMWEKMVPRTIMPGLFVRVLVILICTLYWSSETQGGSQAEGGEWTTEATLLSYIGETRKFEIHSPDNRKIVIVENVGLRVMGDGKLLSGLEHEGVESLAELGWAPDSAAFFITYSDGGTVGQWHTLVYLIEKEKVRRANVTQAVGRHFKKQYTCKNPKEPDIPDEEPEIAGIKWINGSKRLLLVAEVPPHSTCPEMGKVAGYIVTIPSGEIIQELGKKKLMADWNQYLGPRLLSKGNRKR